MRNWISRWVLASPPPHGQARRSEPFQQAGRGGAAPLFRAQASPPPTLQKIMHTRKRHQDLFQDLNRKLQHAEKDKEALGPDSKVCGGKGRALGRWGGSTGWGRAVGEPLRKAVS